MEEEKIGNKICIFIMEQVRIEKISIFCSLLLKIKLKEIKMAGFLTGSGTGDNFHVNITE